MIMFMTTVMMIIIMVDAYADDDFYIFPILPHERPSVSWKMETAT